MVDTYTEKYSKEWTQGEIGCTFFVSTGHGFWGKGKTLYEAAENANVTQAPVHANVWRFPNKLVKSVGPTDMGVEWEWSDFVIEQEKSDEDQTIRQALSNMFRMGANLMIKRHKRTKEVHLVHTR